MPQKGTKAVPRDAAVVAAKKVPVNMKKKKKVVSKKRGSY